MSEPQREVAAAALVAALSALSGERPGGWEYPRTPSVSRVQVLALPQDPTGFPFLRVLAGEHSALHAEAIGSGRNLPPGRAYQDHYNLDIYGGVQDTADAIADTWRNRLRDDVLDVLHANGGLGGAADSILFAASGDRRESVGFNHLAEIGSDRAIFILPITVLLKPILYATTN